MTKKENFNAIANILNEMGNHDFDEFIAHEVELLNKKRTGSKTPTKRQKENEILKEHILGVLSDEGMTVTEIMTTLNEDGLTNQRVSANLKQMVDNGTVNKAVVKGKSLFTLA
jgi:predicted transcriptional regulator